MAVLALLVAALLPPALAWVTPAHSAARAALAWSAFYWTPLVLALLWLVATNYAITADVVGDDVRILTLRGRRVLHLAAIVRVRSFSMWGQYGAAHAFRLHTSSGEHATVVISTPLTFLNRRNAARSTRLRAALAAYADRADPRGRYWLGVAPHPPRLAAARHVLTMMALYLVTALLAVVVIASYITVTVR